MKRILAPIALLAMPLFTDAQDLPAPSPSSKVEQRIGLTDVTVSYSRPSAKGRRIFGDLVPLNEVWRTGANKCTILSTSGPLVINGSTLEAGSYSLFTIPGDGSWQVIFNKNTELWGAQDRKAEEDVLTAKAPVTESAPTETFTIEFANLGQDKADLVLRWEKVAVTLGLEADATKQARINIDAALAEDGADYRAYARAAAFYLDRGIDPKTALAWAQKSVGMEKKYWNTFYLAKAQAANNMFKEAAATGNEAAVLAKGENDGGAMKTYQEKAAEWAAKAAAK